MPNQEIDQPTKAEPRFYYGYAVVIATFVIMLVSYGLHNSFGVFFKPLLAEFGWTRAVTSGAYSLSFILHGLLGIAMGGLTDRFGPKIVVTLCGFLLGLGYLLMSQVSGIWQLYLFYGVMIGVGMGGMFVPLLSTVARWFLKRRSMMTGIVMAGLGAGIFLLTPVVNRLILTYDWRLSFIILAILVFVIVVLCAQFLRRGPTSIAQLRDGGSEVGEQGLKLEARGYSLGEAVRTNQFWITFIMLFCVGFYAYTILVHIVPYATDLGISATTAANILATFGGLSIVGRIIFGTIADRIGNRQVFMIGFTMMLVISFLLVPATKEAWLLYLFAAIFGCASAGAGVLASPIIAELFGMRSHGLIFGVADLGFPIGGALGPFLAGHIFDSAGSYQVHFLICAAVSALGLILAAILRPTNVREVKTRLP